MALISDQNYTYISGKLVEAFEFASRAHHGQTRKDGVTPYISHPAGVALILGKAGCSEETIIAGLLHDVIEDTKHTYEDIEKQFGEKVAKLVLDVTIPPDEDKDQGQEDYLTHLQQASAEASFVSAADLLYNRANVLLDIERGRKPWSKFVEMPKLLLDLDIRRINIIKEKIGDHALVDDLMSQYQKLKMYFNV